MVYCHRVLQRSLVFQRGSASALASDSVWPVFGKWVGVAERLLSSSSYSTKTKAASLTTRFYCCGRGHLDGRCDDLCCGRGRAVATTVDRALEVLLAAGEHIKAPLLSASSASRFFITRIKPAALHLTIKTFHYVTSPIRLVENARRTSRS